MRNLSKEERHSFLVLHLEHRLTVLLAFVSRLSDTAFWQGNGDLFRSAFEGASTMLRVFIEFLGVRSERRGEDIRLVPYKPQGDDVTIESFGVAGLKPEMFGEDSELIAIVHEGIKKGTVHLTWESGHKYKSDEHFLRAVAVVLQHPDLERRCSGHAFSAAAKQSRLAELLVSIVTSTQTQSQLSVGDGNGNRAN